MRLLLIVTVVMFLLTLGLVLLTLFSPGLLSSGSEPSTPTLARSYGVEWIVVFIMGAIFSVMGYRFGVARLFFYGWMLGLAYLASVYMVHTAAWTFHFPAAIAAGIILVIGFTLLLRLTIRFAHRRPEMAKTTGIAPDLLGLAEVDRVVHEPARLMILMVLYGFESADFTFLLNATELTWGNLSSHVTKLEDAEYVKVEKGFVGKKPRTMVQLTDTGRRAIDAYRQTMQGAMKRLG